MLTLKREPNSIVAKEKQNEKASLAEKSLHQKIESIRSNPSTSRVLCTLLSIIGKGSKMPASKILDCARLSDSIVGTY